MRILHIKKWIVLLVLLLILGLTACGGMKDGDYVKSSKLKEASAEINLGIEMSFKLKTAEMETDIRRGSYPKGEAPERIVTSFEAQSKDALERDIDFSVDFIYKDRTENVSNRSNYEGIYLNTLYPHPPYYNLDPKKIESVSVNTTEEGTEYYVFYKETHFSRRMEWEACKVEADYEYFLIDENGVIIKYTSDILYRQKSSAETGEPEENKITVVLKAYELF